MVDQRLAFNRSGGHFLSKVPQVHVSRHFCSSALYTKPSTKPTMGAWQWSALCTLPHRSCYMQDVPRNNFLANAQLANIFLFQSVIRPLENEDASCMLTWKISLIANHQDTFQGSIHVKQVAILIHCHCMAQFPLIKGQGKDIYVTTFLACAVRSTVTNKALITITMAVVISCDNKLLPLFYIRI